LRFNRFSPRFKIVEIPYNPADGVDLVAQHARAVDPVSECTFSRCPSTSADTLCAGAPAMILRAILAFFPLAVCILVVVLAYLQTRDR
jgi:hypothetical protein